MIETGILFRTAGGDDVDAAADPELALKVMAGWDRAGLERTIRSLLGTLAGVDTTICPVDCVACGEHAIGEVPP